MNMTLGFNVSYFEGEGDLKVLRHAIYDENPITTTLNAFVDQDFFYFALLEVKLQHVFPSKTQPTNHTIEFSQSQYSSF